jgi:hypothetical protein
MRSLVYIYNINSNKLNQSSWQAKKIILESQFLVLILR